MTPEPGTTRYETLCSFLESVMIDPRASRRVRLSAAQRLDDLLKRRERAEAAEVRRVEREALRAAKREEQALQQTGATVPDTSSADERLRQMQNHLENITKRGKENTALSTA